MSFVGKNYSYVKHENFDGFLKSVGLSDEKVAAYVNTTPSQKLVKDGDSYKYINTGPDGVKETTFKSGVEFEDFLGNDKIPVKTTFNINGNVVTQTVKAAMGTGTFTREYNGDDLVVTITSDKWDGVAKRYYKA